MKLDGKSVQAAMMQLIEDYKFDPYTVLEIIQNGIRAGFKKDFPDYKKSTIQIAIADDGSVSIYQVFHVAEEIEDPDTQISLPDAKKMREDAKIDEDIFIDVTPENLELSRIASQAAAQTIKQSLKNIERERFFDKFQNKQGELLRAKVIRVQGETVILEIDKTPVVLPPEGQIPHRDYELGEEVFVFLQRIARDKGGVNLEITQSNEDFIVAILKKLVPEFEQGTIAIDKIARVAGKRTKIVVSSTDEKIDPVGVMIGYKGDRINTLLSLLDGEKVDFIEKNDDLDQMIIQSLKPASVSDIEITDDKIFISVPEEQKALAIGKGASNIRLAGQIVGKKIEIR